jgi:hypothetical protein
MESTITINEKKLELDSPPLDIGLTGSPVTWEPMVPENRTAYWTEMKWTVNRTDLYRSLNGSYHDYGTVYQYKDTVFNEDTIIKSGRCFAESNESYSWGFSAQLLLTFACYTAFFATVLIALQVDVFLNSRTKRKDRSYSIYTDVLYLAEELNAIFQNSIEGHLESPKALEKTISGYKSGLRLDIDGLRPSRLHEWKQSFPNPEAVRLTTKPYLASKRKCSSLTPTIAVGNTADKESETGRGWVDGW